MRKEKSILIGILIVFIVAIPGCKMEIENPTACYTLKVQGEDGTKIISAPFIVKVDEAIEFDNCGAAEYYAFFSGKQGSIWADYLDPDDLTTEGSDTNPYGDFYITYQTPGTYTATVVLTNREVKNPSNLKQVTMDFEIEVVVPESTR